MKTKKQKLELYNRTNHKSRKLKQIQRNGFNNEEDYLNYLNQEFTEVKKVTRGELQNIIMNSPDSIITVKYKVQPKIADIRKQLYDLYPNKGHILSKSEYKKKINNVVNLKGRERLITGYHDNNIKAGRVLFYEIDQDNQRRYVDLRTIDSAIINYEIKYIIK